MAGTAQITVRRIGAIIATIRTFGGAPGNGGPLDLDSNWPLDVPVLYQWSFALWIATSILKQHAVWWSYPSHRCLTSWLMGSLYSDLIDAS